MSKTPQAKVRFHFVDQFRGFIGVLMLMGHSSYYLNSIWKNLDPFDPIFPSWGQFALRYAGYLCAPGFLMMAGAMVWWSYHKRIEKGITHRTARWHLIQRGLFLILAQMTWVNSSWSGFKVFQPWHFGIIASIGISMILLSLIIHWKWPLRLLVALSILIIHPFLLNISYDPDNIFMQVVMQTFVDAGKFNKYPVLPWFAMAILGSVMASGWLRIWKTNAQRIYWSLSIAGAVFLLAIFVRMGRAYGNIYPFSDFASWSFFLDQKYPPSLFMNLWFFASVVLGVGIFISIGTLSPKILNVFSIPGKVPLFFYAMHLGILGLFVKRADWFYREGELWMTFVGVGLMLVVMLPLCNWFYGVKRRSSNYFIQMI